MRTMGRSDLRYTRDTITTAWGGASFISPREYPDVVDVP
jgi:hypothetical protein